MVAGASGFLGLPVVAKLRGQGCRITALARRDAKPRLEELGCEVAAMNLGVDRSIPKLARHDLAIFLAQSRRYRNWPDDSPDVLAVNVLGLTQFLEAARRAGVRRLFYFSSGSVYEPSFDPLREDSPVGSRDLYAMSKRMGEEITLHYRGYFDVVILRPFVIYGPGQQDRLVPMILSRVSRSEPISLHPRDISDTNPEGLVVTPCHVEDAARITAALVETSVDGVLNLAGCERVSIRAIAEEAARILGQAPRFEVDAEPRTGDLIADPSRLLGLVQPRFVPFQEGLAETVREGWEGGKAAQLRLRTSRLEGAS
jgi:nucleoside-diphosphate-sugar epimerase